MSVHDAFAREGALYKCGPGLCPGYTRGEFRCGREGGRYNTRPCSGRLRGRASSAIGVPRAQPGATFVERAFARPTTSFLETGVGFAGTMAAKDLEMGERGPVTSSPVAGPATRPAPAGGRGGRCRRRGGTLP